MPSQENFAKRPCGEELKPSGNSHTNELWKWIFQDQLGFQMTATLADSLTGTS